MTQDRIRTSITHGEGVRHPHTFERVGLFGLLRSFVDNVGNDAICCTSKGDMLC